MLRIKPIVRTLAVLALSTGMAAAQSVFPSSVNESASWQTATSAHGASIGSLAGDTGATLPTHFPTSISESGPSRESLPAAHTSAGATIDDNAHAATAVRSSRAAPWLLMGGLTAAFPTSVDETGSLR